MPRIRTIKPEFFRHEGLQDLAKKHGSEIMLVFVGIWTQCDKEGRFPWSPRQLSLDILPFLKIDMPKMLDILGQSKYVLRYTVDGKDYGYIPSFKKHQMIFGSERKYPAKFPEFTGITLDSPRVDLGHWINGIMDKGNNGLQEKDDSRNLNADRAFFDAARKAYPGTKRGLDPEWDNFQKKEPDYTESLPLILPGIEREIAHRKQLAETPGAFIPQWANFTTWINQKRWTQEFGEIINGTNGKHPQQFESSQQRKDRRIREEVARWKSKAGNASVPDFQDVHVMPQGTTGNGHLGLRGPDSHERPG